MNVGFTQNAGIPIPDSRCPIPDARKKDCRLKLEPAAFFL